MTDGAIPRERLLPSNAEEPADHHTHLALGRFRGAFDANTRCSRGGGAKSPSSGAPAARNAAMVSRPAIGSPRAAAQACRPS